MPHRVTLPNLLLSSWPQNLPHVDECYFCTVCVPNSALRLPNEGANLAQPGAQQQQAQQQQSVVSSRRRLRMHKPGSAGYLENPGEAEGLLYGLKPLDGPQPRSSQEGSAAEGCTATGGDCAGGSSSRQHRKLADASLPTDELGGGEGVRTRLGSRRLQEETYNALDSTESGPDYHIGGRVYNITDIAPGRRIFQSKSHLPNCTVCRGCDHTLVSGISPKLWAPG